LIVTNEIPHAFNQSIKVDHTVDKFLDNITCDNGDVKELLLQFVGYTMFSDISAQQAFILTGKGANGKSTFLEMLGAMIGRDNMSTLMLKDFSKNFRLANIVGKLVNIGDDIDDRYIEDISEFKIVSAGGWITVEEKYKKPFDYRSTAKLIFSTNKLPRINDHTDGTKRRLVIVPFLAKFDKNRADYDPFIGRKLAEESAMEYLIVLAIQALHRFLDGGSVFDQPKIVEDAVAQFNQYNNPVEGFLEELPAYLDDHDSIDEQPVRDVYMAYKAYCSEEGIKGVLGKKAFNQMVEDLTGFVKDKVNGQLKWVSAI
jgi:putative DNA primase/helicase